ncbi:ROK family protein [Nonomuraea sp. NBC_01738]|uniref:ROK family protein n=1 Tax=Nonomuraea sp. NBC_01738 TaxID=2976003 RepID=UPI002E108CCC|nr:ROK family protein [Nonomuraea sp. NBC_01738]
MTSHDLRVRNRGQVLRLLRDHGPLSRAELARRTGLSATTMTKVVAQLIGEGCLAEGATGPARPGRPATDVALVPGALWVVGVAGARAGLCDLLGRAVWTRDLSAPADLDRLIGTSGIHGDQVLGLGLAGREPPHGLPDGLEVVRGSEVRARALAEARYGCRAADLLYVHLGERLEAALVLGGRIFDGPCDLAHVRVVDAGDPCECGGTGCLLTVVREPYLDPALLGAALACAVSLLGPADIRLGGDLRDLTDPQLHGVATALRAHPVRLGRATLGRDAAVRGAAALALDRLFYLGL